MLKQNLQLKLSQKLSPQQIQLMKLIQLPTQALEQRIKEEMIDNPALEGASMEETYEEDSYEEDYNEFEEDSDHIDAEDINIDEYLSDDEIPDYKTQSNNYSDDDDDREMPVVATATFHQDLLQQLNTFILEEEDREVFMILSQTYLEWKEAVRRQARQEALEEGLQAGLQETHRGMIENLLQVRFGQLDDSFNLVIEGLLSLSPGESSRLLIESAREDLFKRFHAITPQ